MLEFKVAIIVFTYVVILVEPTQILNRFHNWYFGITRGNIVSELLFHITLGCERCVAGQVAMWTYLFTSIGHYNVLDHVYSVALTIFSVTFIKLLYDKLNT